MSSNPKYHNQYLTAIIAASVAVVFVLVYATTRKEDQGFWSSLLELVRSSITSAVVALAAIPVVYFLFVRKGISSNQQMKDEIVEAVADRLRQGGESLRIKFLQREPLYIASALVIEEATAASGEKKTLLLAALHGHSRRLVKPSRRNPVFEMWDLVMKRCIQSPQWTVQHIFHVTTEERFQMVLDYMDEGRNVEGYEVRVFSFAESLPHLSILVVGEEHLFIAADDPHYYRASECIHIQGQEAVRFGTRYFEALWNDPRTYKLHSAIGRNQGEIDRLREHLHRQEEAAR
jgi:hypothetical protein